MKVKVVGDRVAVKLLDLEDKTASGILLHRPDSTEPKQAEVVGVGDGFRLPDGTYVPSEIKVGEQVLIPHGAGTPMKVDGEEIVVLKEDEVIGVING